MPLSLQVEFLQKRIQEKVGLKPSAYKLTCGNWCLTESKRLSFYPLAEHNFVIKLHLKNCLFAGAASASGASVPDASVPDGIDELIARKVALTHHGKYYFC